MANANQLVGLGFHSDAGSEFIKLWRAAQNQVCVVSWVLTLNILCIFDGLWLRQFWMVQAGWAPLQVSETTGKRETFLNDHP